MITKTLTLENNGFYYSDVARQYICEKFVNKVLGTERPPDVIDVSLALHSQKKAGWRKIRLEKTQDTDMHKGWSDVYISGKRFCDADKTQRDALINNLGVANFFWIKITPVAFAA